ncbi:hypothetical protein P0L94_01790 [Microbacter sp. GSS18]|nr:hypothetical protein P0L94_01790 [Microbacter sp. GSS18]
MTSSARAAGSLAPLSLAAALVACSPDTLVWGVDRAQVIDRTRELITAAASGDEDAFACADGTADFGVPEDWHGMSPGAPARMAAPSPDGDDAAWRIDLDLDAHARSGRLFPAAVLYRETLNGLCVADIAWSTADER